MSVLTIKTKHKTYSYSLFKKLTTVGKDESNDIVLSDPLIDEVHVNIVFDGKNHIITSTKGKNIFYVNGRKKTKYVLKFGDNIKISGIEMKFLEKVEGKSIQKVTHIADYQKLFEVAKKILQYDDIDVVLENLMDAVVEITGADKGFLILSGNNELNIKVARNINKENIADAISQVSDSIVSKVIYSKKPLIVSDALNHEEFSSAKSVMALQLNSVMCVPLLDRGNLIGLIYVGNSNVKGLFVKSTLELLTVFASLASLVVRNALSLNELKWSNKNLSKTLEEIRFGNIIGSSEKMQRVFRTIEKIAPTDVSVLITGETGTGKELIAKEIHRRSIRSKGPFIPINMGAIPENILESELFGHVKGAFTGAVTTKQGRFQSANKGTLFLDEIGDMPLALQVKILRALQEKIVFKVGSQKPEPIDVRIVSATNKNLKEEIKSGRFREDLYYRINVVNIHLPPLRERDDDIIVIAKYLLGRFRKELGSVVTGFTKDAIEALLKYKWAGNIREMENILRRAIVLTDKTLISAEDLGIELSDMQEILPLSQVRENFTKKYILEALAKNNGNKTKTAKDLGVDPRTIFRYLEKQ